MPFPQIKPFSCIISTPLSYPGKSKNFLRSPDYPVQIQTSFIAGLSVLSICFWFLNQDPVRVRAHPRLRNQDFFPKDPRDVEKQLGYMKLRLSRPTDSERRASAGWGPYLQEGQGQRVLAAPQQRLTLVQRLVVQRNAIDLGPTESPSGPCQARGSAQLLTHAGQ